MAAPGAVCPEGCAGGGPETARRNRLLASCAAWYCLPMGKLFTWLPLILVLALVGWLLFARHDGAINNANASFEGVDKTGGEFSDAIRNKFR